MSSNVQGVMWALLGTALFSLSTALAKLAVTEYHVLQILFIRQVIVLASTLPSVLSDLPQSLRIQHPGLHALRIAGAFVALGASIWAVALLPLASAITINFAQVFFIALLAALCLGEQIGRHRIAAICCGFLGVLIAMRPDPRETVLFYALVPLAGAFGAAVAGTCVRKLSQSESSATLLVYQSFFVGLMSGLPMIWLWKTPDLAHVMLLVSIGVIATIGQWVGIHAIRLAEISVIGNVQYAKLIYASILGYLLFAEIPDGWTIAGALIIVGSSLYLVRREATHRV